MAEKSVESQDRSGRVMGIEEGEEETGIGKFEASKSVCELFEYVVHIPRYSGGLHTIYQRTNRQVRSPLSGR